MSKDFSSLESLAKEATILRGFNKMGYPGPEFYEYGEGDDRTLAFIRLEAITPDQGRTATAGDWQEKHARSAIRQIRRMEDANLSLLPRELVEMEAFQTRVRVTEVMVDLAKRAGTHLPDEIRDKLEGLKETGGEVEDVLVHGNMALKNIVIDNKGEVLPVDFELAKVGFLGQDAGKLLSGLRGNPEVFGVALESYIDDGIGGINQDRLRALTIGMATENLVHLVWSVENRPKNDEALAEIKIYVENIKDVLNEVYAN